MRLEMVRVGQSKRGTFGVLRREEVPFVLTLERPWEDNKANISCIPEGRYRCVRTRSPKFGNTFEVTNVPGRTHVLFHSGSFITDTEGCILVAEEFSGTHDAPMVVSSKRGFSEFMLLLEGLNEFELEIFSWPTQNGSQEASATPAPSAGRSTGTMGAIGTA